MIHPGGPQNLAESVIQAALAYRAHAPLIDSLLAEVGLNSTSLAGLTKGIADSGTVPKIVPGNTPDQPS